MQTLIHMLRSIGLSEKEAIIYCVNFRIGPNPASVIAKQSKLHRCTAYALLDSLKRKGLVKQYEKNKIRYFAASVPKELITYINQQINTLSYFKEEIEASLCQFNMLKKEPPL